MGTSNPMRWNCTKQGCFNLKKRPKIEVFADLFPGDIAMGDVDGLVEIKGYFLFIEWNGFKGDIPRGQARAFEAQTESEIVLDRRIIFVIAGDAETMSVESVKVFKNGTEGEWKDMDKDALRELIKKWVAWARHQQRASDQVREYKSGGRK